MAVESGMYDFYFVFRENKMLKLFRQLKMDSAQAMGMLPITCKRKGIIHENSSN